MQNNESVDAKTSRKCTRDDPLLLVPVVPGRTPLARCNQQRCRSLWARLDPCYANYRSRGEGGLPIRGSLSPPFGASIHPLIPLTFSAGPFRLARSRLHSGGLSPTAKAIHPAGAFLGRPKRPQRGHSPQPTFFTAFTCLLRAAVHSFLSVIILLVRAVLGTKYEVRRPLWVLVVSRLSGDFHERSKPGAPPSEECPTSPRPSKSSSWICCNPLQTRPMLASCVPQPRISNAFGRANHSM